MQENEDGDTVNADVDLVFETADGGWGTAYGLDEAEQTHSALLERSRNP